MFPAWAIAAPMEELLRCLLARLTLGGPYRALRPTAPMAPEGARPTATDEVLPQCALIALA